ncbi:MAG: SGNH/GDSL hydrolase family protein [Deltaproteobacteria bacterium]|nr:SGNH/GDSL hydrolase family protein [Deltaproteobacteria bacterium]
MSDSHESRHFKTILEKLRRGDAIQIVGLGDSLTYGWEASVSYFDLFVSRLRADYCGTAITGHNAGICGDTAGGGAGRIGRLLEISPDAVIVQFGINDLYAGVSVDSYRASVGAICRRVIRANAVPLLITSGPLLYPEQQRDIAPYYDALKATAMAYDCLCADVASYIRERSTDLVALYFDDGVHPNDAGYRAMSDALYDICHL